MSDRQHPLAALTRARLYEFVREPEALFWVFAFPILMALVLGFAFRDRPPDPVPVGVVAGPSAAELTRVLAQAGTVRPIPYSALAEGLEGLRTGKIALLVEEGSSLVYHFDRTRPDARIARLEVDDAIQRARGRRDPSPAREALVHEKGSRYIDFLLPGILGLNLMGTGIWGIGFSIVNARLKKTLKLMVATPMRKSDFLLAQMLSRFVFLVVEVAVILAFGVAAFEVPVRGSPRSLVADHGPRSALFRRHRPARRGPRPHARSRQRPHEPRHGSDVAVFRSLLLLRALSEGRPAVHPGPAADRPEQRPARRHARRPRASRGRRGAGGPRPLGSRRLHGRFEDLSLAIAGSDSGILPGQASSLAKHICGGTVIETLIVNQAEVPRLLPMKDCIEVMARAFAALARGEATLPQRQIVWLPDRSGALGLMPAHLTALGAVGVKAVTFFPRNEGTDLDSHQGAVLLFESGRGRLLAVIDATSVTAVRTAAVTALATRLLAREDAGDLALVGSGVQARTHLEALLLVRKIRRVRVASKTPDRARSFAERESKRHGIAVIPCASAREAVEGADIVCAVTSSREPVVFGQWLAPGAHVNAVGSSVASARELDTAAVVRSRLFVDRREAALAEAGDFLIARSEGAVTDAHIAGELGEVLTGSVAGRTSPSEITVFKSVGLAIEDVAAAHHIYSKARGSGFGKFVEFGGGRHEAD